MLQAYVQYDTDKVMSMRAQPILPNVQWESVEN